MLAGPGLGGIGEIEGSGEPGKSGTSGKPVGFGASEESGEIGVTRLASTLTARLATSLCWMTAVIQTDS